VTKSELVAALAKENATLTRRHAEVVVNTIFDVMRGALVEGDRIEIRGFGTFQVRTHEPKMGRNPRTGDSVPIGRRRVPFFRVGKELRERVDDHDA